MDYFWPLDLATLSRTSAPTTQPCYPSDHLRNSVPVSQNQRNPTQQSHSRQPLQSCLPQQQQYNQFDEVESANSLRPFIRAYLEYQYAHTRNSSQGHTHCPTSTNASSPQTHQFPPLNYHPPNSRMDGSLGSAPIAHARGQSVMDPLPGWPYAKPQPSSRPAHRGPE